MIAQNFSYYSTDSLGLNAFLFGEALGKYGSGSKKGTNYLSGGSPMPDRSLNLNSYKYGYQGQEKESLTGQISFQLRGYDPQLLRFHNPDPYGQFISSYLAMGNNPVNNIDPDGGWTDEYEINITTGVSEKVSDKGGDETHYFNIVEELDGEKVDVASYELDAYRGLVEFPGSSFIFNRYGVEDAGGSTSSEYAQNGDIILGGFIAPGDHYLKPEVAADLFGLTFDLANEGVFMAYGDMSNSHGKAPGGDHSTHGGDNGGSGACVDFRYVNSKGMPVQSSFSKKGNDLDIRYNLLIYKKAYSWNFTSNYGPNANTPKVKLLNAMGVEGLSGHNNHGHLGHETAGFRIHSPVQWD